MYRLTVDIFNSYSQKEETICCSVRWTKGMPTALNTSIISILKTMQNSMKLWILDSARG